MAKDPACLFYWNDWHGGTVGLTRHLKGCYMDILHAQFNLGRLRQHAIVSVLGPDFPDAWPVLKEKFTEDEQGRFYNPRLEQEIERRRKYTTSRVENLSQKKSSHMADHKGSHMADHMGAHMEIEIRNRNRNRKEKSETEIKSAPKFEKSKADAVKVMEHLNAVSGHTYDTTNKQHLAAILPRLADCGLEACINVIDLKSHEWKGTDLERYLRPATLFSAKNFQKYLDEVTYVQKSGKKPKKKSNDKNDLKSSVAALYDKPTD